MGYALGSVSPIVMSCQNIMEVIASACTGATTSAREKTERIVALLVSRRGSASNQATAISGSGCG